MLLDVGEDSEIVGNPLDKIEEFVSLRQWVFDRRSDREMAVELPGVWCDFGLFFSWSEDLHAIHFSCALDLHIQPRVLSRVYELLAKINEKLWMGHFAVWVEEGIPMFRHTISCSQGEIDFHYVSRLLDIAKSECERFYPAFQFVIWGGQSADAAISNALLDTLGQA